MNVDVNAPYHSRVRQALEDTNLRTALDRATGRLSSRRAGAMEAIDSTSLRDHTRAVREHAVRNLPDLLEELERNLKRNGCQVHWARDAKEAQDIVRDIARQHGVQSAVKSKSMLTEEIHLNQALEADGIKVTETDLGEYIIQLADEPPSHILAPVIHKRAEDISALFEKELGMEPTDDPAKMCSAARAALRDEFLSADMGISGCNFAVAETGTICVITNEGNGRMVTTMPPLYVAIAGIEKVLGTVEDAVLLWQAACRNATGQDVSVYFSLSSGPRRAGHADGPEEMHVVLLDNGRSRVLERGYADALLCIRCSACVNACPVYKQIGGHAYGCTPYSGPIGAVMTPLLADDMNEFKELPFASSLCGECREVCPVKIDLPRMLLDLRADLGGSSLIDKAAVKAFSMTMKTPGRYTRMVRFGKWISRMLPHRSDGHITALPPPLKAWSRSRLFPPVPSKSFRTLWRERRGSGFGAKR